MRKHYQLNRLFSVLVLAGMLLSIVMPAGFVQAAVSEKAFPSEGQRDEPPPDRLHPVVRPAVRHDVSQPLGKLAEATALGTRPLEQQQMEKSQTTSEEIPFFLLPKATSAGDIGSRDMSIVQQSQSVGAKMPPTDFNFEGVNNVNGVLPPDTNGDIGYDPATGKKYYMQWVNLSLAVWDVTNNPPTLVMGPVNGNSIWSGFGGMCETHNDGDPIVLYDHLAGQWMISQFALDFSAPDFHQCIAISETGDPTGSWYRYDFQISTTKMNDYPHFGVWPDGYYMSINQFDAATWGWAGAGVVAFERDKMLQGQNAQMVYFDLASVNMDYGGMLPSDLDGAVPPSGAPNYFAEWDDSSWIGPDDALRIWEFHVDWANPANSTFGVNGDPNYVIPTADVDPSMCNFARNCIPQPGGTALDAIADRLMYRLQYRNFGDHQALVGNKTVDSDGTDHAGVYWFELRNPGTGWNMYQEGVYAPDSDNRWMGSIAMDQSGNIALGYSVSSASTYPSIRYDGRLDGDPLGQMTQGEAELVAGGGSQSHSSGRWGDYSMMGVDPTDDCTFWYTQEYYGADSTAGWQTRIGSFRFPTCGAHIARGTLTGVVDDGTAPLAGITVRAVGGTVDLATATNVSGTYTLTLPVGDYDVSAFGYGYQSASVSDVAIVTDTVTTQNFTLSPAAMYTLDGIISDAYLTATQVISEAFDSGLPANWTVVDNAGNGVEWQACSAWGVNYTGGAGDCAGVSSDAAGQAEFDTELHSPVIDLSNAVAAELTYKANYQNFAAHDFLNVDVSTDGGTTWDTLLSWNEDHGAFFSTPGEDVTLDLSGYAGKQIILRWHYYDPGNNDYDWYAQIDQVSIIAQEPVVRWPLYAHVSVSSDAPGFPGAETWTNPVTGQYSFTLAEGYTYTLDVDAFSDGYLPASVDVPDLSGDTTKDIFLVADMSTCVAPGYGFSGFQETFEAGVPPAGWTVTDNAGGITWMTNVDYGDGNYTGGDGLAADVNSDQYAGWPYDTELRTPSLDMTALPATNLDYKFNFQVYSGYEALDVDISTDGGTTWTNLRHWTTDQGALYGLPGASDALDLSAYAAETDVIIRWRYYTPDASPWDWYAQVDDVRIGQCEPLDGGMVVGNVYDARTSQALTGATVAGDGAVVPSVGTPDDPAVDEGFYSIFSSAGSHVFTATMQSYGPDAETVTVAENAAVRQDFYLPAGLLTAAPNGLSITLPMGVSDTLTMTVNNMGTYTAAYRLGEVDGGRIPLGPFERPDWVTKPFKSYDADARRAQRKAPDVPPYAAGDVLQTWPASAQGSPWGLAYDGFSGSVWVGEGWGSKEIFNYAADGTYTGISYPFPWNPAYGPADATFNVNTGMLWIMDVGGDNCIHEIDPALGVTGNTICPGFSASQRGLAYDPNTDTYFAGGWNDAMVYRFDASGNILASVNTGLPISGLAYNPDTQHLFVMANASSTMVYVLDVANGYTNIGSFSISGFGSYGGAGLGIDCNGNLWAVDQSTNTVYQFESGETAGFCDVPWLSETPTIGTLAPAASDVISVTFDASVPEVDQPGEYHAAIRVNNDTPYAAPLVPVTMTVTAPPTWGKLEGTVTDLAQCHVGPTPVEGAEVLIEASTGAMMTTTVQTTVFSEDFESWPLTGWSIVDNAGTGNVWDSNDAFGKPNRTPGSGYSADADSDAVCSGSWDTELWSPAIDLSGYLTATLTFASNFQDYAGSGEAWVDVSTDGGTSWANVFYATTDEPSDGIVHSIDLSAYAGQTIVVRWRYSDNGDGCAWYWQIDDVVVIGENNIFTYTPDSWTTTTDANGYYGFWLDESHSPLTVTVTAPGYDPAIASGINVVSGTTTTHDFEVWKLEPCVTADPDALEVTVDWGMTTTLRFDLTNGGGISTTFELEEKNGGFALAVPVPAYVPPAASTQGIGVSQFGEANVTGESKVLAPSGSLLLDQPPNQANGLFSDADCDICTSGAQSIAENFVIAAPATIGEINFWTGYYPGDVPPALDSITVIFHEDSGGLPGAAIYTEANVSYSRIQTGVTLFGVHEWMHTLTLATPLTLPPGNYWVEIYNSTGTGDDFFWETGDLDAVSGLPGAAWAPAAPGAGWNYDSSVELAIQLVEASTDIPWLSEVPITGTLLGIAGTAPIFAIFDASVPEVTQPGVYTGTLSVASDDPAAPLLLPVTMTVTSPATWGKIEGTVTGMGYCDTDPMPLEGAEVLIESRTGYTEVLTTDENGYFGLWLDEANSPVKLTITAPDHEIGSASTVVVSAGNTTTQDFNLRWLQPCVRTAPTSFDVTMGMTQTLTQTLTIFNNGAVATDFTISEETDMPWLSLTPLAGTVASDAQSDVYVIFNTSVFTQTGNYTATLQITTDDPITPTIDVPVYLHVVTYRLYLPLIFKTP